MHAHLARKLVESGAIRENTEFEAYFSTHGLSCQEDARLLGRFRLLSAGVSAASDQVTFQGCTGENRIPHRFSNEDIVSVDGMPPHRLAALYNMTDTGDAVPVGRRRGRKPRPKA